MPSHGYLPADKKAFKVCEQDFYFGGLHKKQVRQFDAFAMCTGCKRAGKPCHKKLYFNDNTPETIGLIKNFSTFHNPVVGTGGHATCAGSCDGCPNSSKSPENVYCGCIVSAGVITCSTLRKSTGSLWKLPFHTSYCLVGSSGAAMLHPCAS